MTSSKKILPEASTPPWLRKSATIQRLRTPQIHHQSKKRACSQNSPGTPIQARVPLYQLFGIGPVNLSFLFNVYNSLRPPRCRPQLTRLVRCPWLVSEIGVPLCCTIANILCSSYRSRRSSPRWLGLKRTRTPLSIWVRTDFRPILYLLLERLDWHSAKDNWRPSLLSSSVSFWLHLEVVAAVVVVSYSLIMSCIYTFRR